MQISVEKTSDIGRQIKIVIPEATINDLISTKTKQLTKQIKINGFRAGHVPLKLINEKYGHELKKEALSETIDAALNKAISENKITPAGEIKLEETKQELEYIFSLEVYPEIKLDHNFANLQINSPKVVITEQDLDEGLLKIRKQFGKKVTIDTRAAKLGDFLTVDFIGFIDGKEFPNNKDQNAMVEIGGEQFIDGFESGLIATKTGEVKELKLQFPDSYAEKELAGKQVIFNITVKKIEENQLAEINEDLAKALNIENNDVSKIRSTIRTNMENYVQQLIKSKERESLCEVLLTTYPVSIPSKLLIDEQKNLERTFKQSNQEHGIVIKELNAVTIAEIQAQAYKNVHLSLLLQEIININNLQIDQNILNHKIQELNMLFKDQFAAAKYKNIYNNMKHTIMQSMLTNMALDFAMTQITKIEQMLTFDELSTS